MVVVSDGKLLGSKKMRIEKTTENKMKEELEKFIDHGIRSYPCIADMPSTKAYLDMKNPTKDYKKYLMLTKENFEDYVLRQIYFVCVKLSLRKYYPEKAPVIDKVHSEDMTMKQLDKYIEEL